MWPLRINWFTVAKFGVPIIAVIVVLWQVNDRAYNRGHAAATKICTEVTVPAARLEEQTKCTESTQILKESCDALQSRLNDNVDLYVGLLKRYDSCKKIPITTGVRVDAETTNGDVLLMQGSVLVGELADTAKACDDQTDQLIEWQSWYGKVKIYFDRWNNQ